ncbi:AAA family ATPase [Paeniroseomonas aquatica]|uniref:AAA family ATPase n=1 Tax=Paeniroseomonas aquatica TaxID=373043 RepID=UPI0036121D18
MLRLQQARGFRLAMLGDDRQCQAIEAGPIVDLVRRALGEAQVPEILTTVRQRAEREREIAGHWREGRATEALAMKRADGTAELVPGGPGEAVERVGQLVGERLRANAGDAGYTLTVSAPTNADAHRLGLAIREVRRGLGQVGPDQVRVQAADRDGNAYEMALAPGDRVRLFASTPAEERGSIGRNGSILTVLSADAKGLRVRNAGGREGRVAWTTLADATGRARLAYGEAMTTHTAQGSTATEHIHALPGGSKAVTGFAAYASGTRHRRAAWLVLSAGAEQAEVVRRRPLNDVRPVTEADAWANVARNLGRQPRQEGALEFLARVGEVRRGAARALQRGVRSAERREAEGLAPTVLQDRLARGRRGRVVAPMEKRLDDGVRQRAALVERLSRLGSDLARAVRERTARLHPSQRGHKRGGPSNTLRM